MFAWQARQVMLRLPAPPRHVPRGLGGATACVVRCSVRMMSAQTNCRRTHRTFSANCRPIVGELPAPFSRQCWSCRAVTPVACRGSGGGLGGMRGATGVLARSAGRVRPWLNSLMTALGVVPKCDTPGAGDDDLSSRQRVLAAGPAQVLLVPQTYGQRHANPRRLLISAASCPVTQAISLSSA